MKKSTDGLVQFMKRYETFSQEWETNYLEQLKVDFEKFKSAIGTLQKEAAKKERLVASNFNIFQVLGVVSDEVKTHSAFLANLLNPAGTHAQQYLFLESFLAMCAETYQAEGFYFPSGDIRNGRWRIEKEKIYRSNRIDLVISNRTLQYMLVIENKIYAPEQDDQLIRYSEWLARQKAVFEKQALIFLTIRGDPSRTAGNHPYLCMSYREHIYNWLERTLPDIKAPRIQESVKQYIDIIKWL